jgi:hypothetical protein
MPEIGPAPEGQATTKDGAAVSDEAIEARRALQESLDLRDQGHLDHGDGPAHPGS